MSGSDINWKSGIVIVPTLPVVLPTNDDKVGILTALRYQCYAIAWEFTIKVDETLT